MISSSTGGKDITQGRICGCHQVWCLIGVVRRAGQVAVRARYVGPITVWGCDPQTCITTTPRPILLLKNIMKEPGTVITRGSTLNNAANLASKFLERIVRKYQGTRLGRQELDAEILEDLEGALWRRSVIDEHRRKLHEIPELQRIVVAIDPAMSSEDDSNETGIIAAGLGADGDGYVLDDVSGIMAPLEWASEAIALYRARQADRIIAEVNNGGDMVENALRTVDRNVSYGRVWATKGKFVRAEPVSSLYQQGRVHHVGSFDRLEDQMCAFTADFDRKAMGYSPDRMDALVWALTELMVESDERRPIFTSA
jgi:phage terminase large subunit-like protein